MISYNISDLDSMEFVSRLKLINSITGYKPANLIGTKNKAGITNLAIVSSVVHMGSEPPLIGFVIKSFGERHTMHNILETGVYTINHINQHHVRQAHFTSVEFPKELSEFDQCDLTPQYFNNFQAPFVLESKIKIGLSLVESHLIETNKTTLIIGKVEMILMEEPYFDQEIGLDLTSAESVCISGLDTYYLPTKLERFPYANEDSWTAWRNGSGIK
jgi:flavin reductase (DIM6/NTAB) family NADH-FMN oxidoreductase RutF